MFKMEEKQTIDDILNKLDGYPKWMQGIIIDGIFKKNLDIGAISYQFKRINNESRKGLVMFLNRAIEWYDQEIDQTQISLNGANKNPEWVTPFTVLISPTMKCNYKCGGCYAAKYEKEKDLDEEILKRIFNDCQKANVPLETILGGEPLIMFNKIFPLIETHKKDSYFQIFTNGSLLDENKLERIADSGNVALMFSIEGEEKETDERRGKGVYRNVMKAIEKTRKKGILYGLSFYVSRQNAKTLLNVNYWDRIIERTSNPAVTWFFLAMSVGKGDTLSMPTPQQRLELKGVRDYLRNNYKRIFLIDFWNDAPYVGGCIAGGRRFFHINHRGDAEPCIFMHYATDNIYDIYKRIKEKENGVMIAANSPFFKGFRRRQPYDNNLYLPCTIIDHPHILREVVKEYNATPTEDSANLLILDPKVMADLDKYSGEVKQLYGPVWKNDKDLILKFDTGWNQKIVKLINLLKRRN